jgi:hypothetical protein
MIEPQLGGYVVPVAPVWKPAGSGGSGATLGVVLGASVPVVGVSGAGLGDGIAGI